MNSCVIVDTKKPLAPKSVRMAASEGMRDNVQKLLAKGLDEQQIAQGLGIAQEDVAAMAVIPTTNKVMLRGEETRNKIAGLRNKAIGVLDMIMDNDDFPHLQLGAAKFALEIDLGKHDAPVANQQPANVPQINNIILMGLDVHDEMEKEFGHKVVDVEEVVQPVQASK